MKLDYRRTFLVGLAFFSICAFWQMYDNVIPLMLTGTFGLDKTWSGAIMAADNVLALFLLPLFGKLSDSCRAPLGRRSPFILTGTAIAVVLMFLPKYRKKPRHLPMRRPPQRSRCRRWRALKALLCTIRTNLLL